MFTGVGKCPNVSHHPTIGDIISNRYSVWWCERNPQKGHQSQPLFMDIHPTTDISIWCIYQSRLNGITRNHKYRYPLLTMAQYRTYGIIVKLPWYAFKLLFTAKQLANGIPPLRIYDNPSVYTHTYIYHPWFIPPSLSILIPICTAARLGGL